MSPRCSLLLLRLFPQCHDFIPQLLPFLAFGIGQLGQGVAADAGEIGILLPVLQPLLHEVGRAGPLSTSWAYRARSALSGYGGGGRGLPLEERADRQAQAGQQWAAVQFLVGIQDARARGR